MIPPAQISDKRVSRVDTDHWDLKRGHETRVMDATDTPLIFALAALLICSAFASASETALFGITNGQRAMLKRTNPRLWRMVESLLARPRELLTQVLLLNMVVNVAYFIVTSMLTISAGSAWMRVVISMGSLGMIILVGEVFAKLYAASATMLFLRLAGPMHLMIRKPIEPMLRFLDVWVVSPSSRLLAPGASRAQSRAVSPAQMDTLIHLGANDGLIDQGEQELLSSIVSMGEMRVEQIMTPRVDMVWIGFETTHQEIIELCRSSGRTGMLVCQDGIDSGVAGIVNARTVLEGKPIRDAMCEVLFIPEQGRLDALIEQFRATSQSVAVCVDEHGGVSGIVTLGDVTNELVSGSASSDHELVNEIEQVGEGEWIVPGRLTIRDWSMLLNDEAVIEHTKRVNTIGGLVMVLLDRIPKPGDMVRVGAVQLTAIAMKEHSIEQVRVELIADARDAGDGGAS